MLTPYERDFALRQLDQSTSRLLRMAESLTSDQLLYRPDPGRWSIAENIEHLAVVERRVVGAIDKLLQEPADNSKQSAFCDAEVMWRVGTVVEQLAAPERALPTLRWPPGVLLQEFETIRRQSRDFIEATAGDLRRHFIPHPFFGDLDCFQWLLLIGAHCNRHAAQSEAVRASRGFPEG